MSRNRDLLVAVVLALVFHGGLYSAPAGWLVTSGPQVLIARGLTAIEVELASPVREVEVPEIEEPRREVRIEPPEVPEHPEPLVRPEDIVLPRAPEDETPPPEMPESEPPRPVEAVPPPAVGADVPRGAKRARTLGLAKPVYPEYCRAHGIEGVVALLIEVLPSGRAGAVIVKSSSGSWRLDRAAEKFYLDVARYSPARRFGRPVRSSLTLNVRFELTDEERGGLEPGPGP